MENKKAEEWSISITVPDFGPRKVTEKELADHIAERNSIVNVYFILSKFNEILKENESTLYQDGQDGIFIPDGAVRINGIYAAINNETGLFDLPTIPDKWDENTIVRTRSPFDGMF